MSENEGKEQKKPGEDSKDSELSNEQLESVSGGIGIINSAKLERPMSNIGTGSALPGATALGETTGPIGTGVAVPGPTGTQLKTN